MSLRQNLPPIITDEAAKLEARLGEPGGAALVHVAGGESVQDALNGKASSSSLANLQANVQNDIERIEGQVQNGFVRPEDFGVPGVGPDDNNLFALAAATGKRIEAGGPEYKLNQLTLATSVDLRFSDSTVIRNMQTGGTKKAAITIEGALVGPAISVVNFTLINSGGVFASLRVGQQTRMFNVTDPSQLAVGDTLRISENEPLVASTRKGTPEPENQDLNCREFITIASISGNTVTIEEFIRRPYSAAKSLTVQKVAFVKHAKISGGKWIGPNTGGGAVAFKFCRWSYAGDMDVSGISEAPAGRMGYVPILFEDCWESVRGPISARWCLFAHMSFRNQSCTFGPVHASKRTQNGGIYVSSDMWCNFEMAVQDAPGTVNGDQLGLANAACGNNFAPVTGTGSNCYSAWVREGCNDNTFQSFTSINGITVGVQDYGDRNIWKIIKVRGHPSGGVIFGGNYTQAKVDIEVEGMGVMIGNDARGLLVSGRSVSTGTTFTSYDLQIGLRVRDSKIELNGGKRGISWAAGAVANFSNRITISGQNPTHISGRDFLGGERFRRFQAGLTDTNPFPLKIPGYDLDGSGNPIDTDDGLINVPVVTGDAGVFYEVKLVRNTTGPTFLGAWSEYTVITRQGQFAFQKVAMGAPTAPAGVAEVPRLRTVAAVPATETTPYIPPYLEVYIGTATSSQVLVEVKRV